MIFSFSFAPPKSNIETCPSKPFLSLFIVSIIFSNDAINVFLVCPSSSNAPAFIKLSMHFLLAEESLILSQKSLKSLNSPFFSLSATISSTAAVPTFLTLPSPKRILLLSTVNFVKLLFISGFSICISSLLHSSI